MLKAPAPPPSPPAPPASASTFIFGDLERQLRAYAHLARVTAVLTKWCGRPFDVDIEVHLSKHITPDGAVALQIGNVWVDWDDPEEIVAPPVWDDALATAFLRTLERLAQRWNELLDEARAWEGPETFNAKIYVKVNNGWPRPAARARAADRAGQRRRP